MTDGKKPERKPYGESIRDILNPALEDRRRLEVQLKILDGIFGQITPLLPSIVNQNLEDIFNAASRAKNNPDLKNVIIIRDLTDVKGYSPFVHLQLPISTDFTKFSAEDIRELPNFIKLHELARAENVTIQLSYLTAEDARPEVSPRMTINCLKTYEEGAEDRNSCYPELPPLPKKQSNGKPNGEFEM